MTIHFNNDYLEALYQNEAIPGKPKFSKEVILSFKKKILILQQATSITEIQKFNSLNFEFLKGNYQGFCSIRIDKKYRLILKIEGEDTLRAEVLIIEDLTNHYG